MHINCLMILLFVVKLVVGVTELDSLLEIKRGIREDASGKVLSSWDPKSFSSNGCPVDWYGITCSNGHVTSIMLDALGLVGSFHFASFTMLRNLSISGNSFEGTVSNEIGSVSSLEYLDVSSNLLHGPLPVVITSLKRLVHLNLSLNNLEGTVPSSLGNLKQLKYLDLLSNNFSGDVMDLLSQLGSVVYVDLSSNGFIGTLDLGLGSDQFVSAIEYLNVSDNNIGGNLFAHDGLPYFDNLEVFDASRNQFVGTVPSFNFMVSLRILRLGSNKLSGSLPEALLQESSMILSELDLSLNELIGPVMSISSITLRSLNLSSNKLTGMLPLIIGHCATIDLSSNLLSGNLSRIQAWGNYVEEIDLSSNLLTGTFPIQTSQFLRLTSFKISNNTIGGTLLPGLFNSARLNYLNMSFNNFNGTIPIQQNDSLVNLEFLDLSHNSLTDHLPRGFGNFRNLALLDLSNNQIEGDIPDNLPGSLTVLDVSYNNLSGVVPENLKNFPDSSFHPGNVLLSFPHSVSSPQDDRNINTGHTSRNRSYIKPALIAGLIGAVFSLALLTLIVCYRTQQHHKKNQHSKKIIEQENQQEISSVVATSAPNSSPKFTTTAEHSISVGEGPKDLMAERKVEEAFPIVPVPVMSLGNPSSSSNTHEEMLPGSLKVCSPDKLIGELHLFHSSLVFSAQDLSSAPAEMIGRSCHGTLYKAILQSGHVLAVKWLKEGIAKGRKEFAREVTKLGSIKHPNLVSLQGYYWGPREYEKMLISNYIDAPCLSLYLNEADARNLPTLDLVDRYRIAVDIARCISYLHNEIAIPHAEQVLTAGALGYRPPEFCSTSKPCPDDSGPQWGGGGSDRVEDMLKVALRCILPADERPDMRSVLEDLTPIAENAMEFELRNKILICLFYHFKLDIIASVNGDNCGIWACGEGKHTTHCYGIAYPSPDEDTRKTQPLSEGTNFDLKTQGEIQPEALVTDLSGPGTKYQVDQTQSTRFEVSDPDHNKGKTSSEVEPNTEPLLLATVGDIQALLGDSKDDLKDESDEEMFEAGEEMDEEIL
nr:probable inactive receptor kinase At5g10020 [Tanacetum cinerariifolium]